MRKIRLFCIPYAGGSASVFNKWKEDLNRFIHICPIELAGRGRRITEPQYESAEKAADDIIAKIKFELRDAPYAFYGHSLGALLSFIITQKLRDMKYPEPAHIFFSGRGAPHIRREDKEPYHLLPPDEFRARIVDLGGTPPDFFDIPELMEILLPILKNDFKISWEYSHPTEIKPLDCDITVLTGKDEDLNPDQVDEWKLHTKYNCSFHAMEGGHFFLNEPENRKKIMTIINDTLNEVTRRRIPRTA